MNITLTPDATLPTYGTAGAAAFDLYASEDVLVWESDQPATLVPTGLRVAVPEGWVLLLFARSGHACKRGLRLATGTSVIDPDYRGEVRVPLVSDHPIDRGVLVRKGDRIAQAMLVHAPRVVLEVVDALPDTERGAGGFGSTN